MHELTIAKSIVDCAVAEARQHGASCIHGVRCRIGRMRFVDELLLREAFAIAREGTPAATATLTLATSGMMLDCLTCGQSVGILDLAFHCPQCGSGEVRLSGGEELELTGLDLEVPDDH